MDPLSIASGIAGLITLSTPVLAAGYNYVRSVTDAPEDLRSLVRETGSLNALLSELMAHSLVEVIDHQTKIEISTQQQTLQECEDILHGIESLVRACKDGHDSQTKHAVNTVFWPLRQKEITRLRSRLMRLFTILSASISIENSMVLQNLKHEQRRGNSIMRGLEKNSRDLQEQKMLDWLSSLDSTAKHLSTSELRHPDTYKWFLEEKTFLDWKRKGTIFWLQGLSGTGKTVLMSAVINDIERYLGLTEGLAYHYCDFANPPSLEPCAIVGSLIRQLAPQLDHTLPAIQHLYNRCSGKSPSFELLTELLHDILVPGSKTIYLMIDALDECPNRQQLLYAIQKLLKQCDNEGLIKIMLSSRPEHDIKNELLSVSTFLIAPHNLERDMEIHVRAELSKLPKLQSMHFSDKESLIQNLITQSEGMFRWVHCQLHALRDIRTRFALKRALNILPKGLDETYDRILNSITDEDCDYVRRILLWMMGSERPLSLRELAEAIALNPMKDHLDDSERLLEPNDLFQLCGSLIRVENNQTIVLAHYSVREYLLSRELSGKEQRISRFALDSRDSWRHVSMCLLSYAVSIGFRMKEMHNDTLDEEEFPLLAFLKEADIERFKDFPAMNRWMKTHLFAEETNGNGWISLIDRLQLSIENKSNVPTVRLVQRVIRCSLMCFWNGQLSRTKGTYEDLFLLEVVEQVGAFFLRWQSTWEDPMETPNIEYMTDWASINPLCIAAAFDFEHALRFLLRQGALVDGIGSPMECHGNPLLRAVYYNNSVATRLLVDNGADINIRTNQNRVDTVLKMAALRSSDMTRYLLFERNIDTNLIDNYGRTIHYWARHDTQIMRTLQPFSQFLESARENSVDVFDAKRLYSKILICLNDSKSYSALSKYLFHAGTEFIAYGAMMAEQNLVHGGTIDHLCHCNICVSSFGRQDPVIRGPRFICLDCVDYDLCVNCYHNWKESDGEMEFCKGHTFYEIPRPRWYEFEDGVVMEDGSTFPQALKYLKRRFTGLLRDTRN